MDAAIDASNLTVVVKNARVFDDGGTLHSTAANFTALPAIELTEAESRQLFVVHASVAYNDIALLPFSVLPPLFSF